MVRSFVPPFFVTFFIALFVLVMQTVWLYLDDIAGKGVGFLLLVELLAYMSISMIPMALPIAVLISSVMVLGNLAERYELLSMKSAGVHLSRVMASLIVVTFAIGLFSFFCSNNFIPVSNLQFKSRLYDIRKQKPTLNLETGIFNDDFEGYAIRMAKKDSDNKTIHDVLIIDHSNSSKGELIEIAADRGEMFVTEDEQFFIMRLYDGWQYQEANSSSQTYPFVRTSFEEWNKVFDLSEFKLDQTDRELFKSHHSMLTAGQLLDAIDSVDMDILHRQQDVRERNRKYFHPYKLMLQAERNQAGRDSISEEQANTPSVNLKELLPKNRAFVEELERVRAAQQSEEKKTNLVKTANRTRPLRQENTDRLEELESFLETMPRYQQVSLLSKAKSFARTIHSQTENAIRAIERRRESRVDYVFEFHNKFSMAVACILFLFIGAPMGAIVRKGGFGVPLLVAIGFFMIYMVITITSKNLAERGVLQEILAAWLPCMMLFPLGFILTYFAMNDYKANVQSQFFTKILTAFKWVARLLGMG